MLQVFDMPASLAFYRDVLGFAFVQTAPGAQEVTGIAPYGMKQLYVADPDGFALCFQWNVDASATGSPD